MEQSRHVDNLVEKAAKKSYSFMYFLRQSKRTKMYIYCISVRPFVERASLSSITQYITICSSTSNSFDVVPRESYFRANLMLKLFFIQSFEKRQALKKDIRERAVITVERNYRRSKKKLHPLQPEL